MEDTAQILVVDDEECLAEMVASALRFAGYGVSTERNGFDALRVEEETPDTTTDTTVAEEPGAPSEDRPQGGHRNGECEERANEDDTSADT
jgi:hypothetical protein